MKFIHKKEFTKNVKKFKNGKQKLDELEVVSHTNTYSNA